MTMTTTKVGHVGWRQANWDEVLAEVNNDERFPADITHVLLERTEHIEFVTKAEAIATGLFIQYWPSGHLFNSNWELNWEKKSNHFLLRLLTEGRLPDDWQEQHFETGEDVSLLLFGERKYEDDPGWREARIPRWLEYPVEKAKGRVRLITIPYLWEGMVVRMRLKGVRSDETISSGT